MTDITSLLACPRCDKTPLETTDEALRCNACKVDFPILEGMPWMFSEPQSALGEWRGRLQFSLQQLSQEIAGLESELQNDDLPALSTRRVQRYKKSLETHKRSLQKLLQPVEMQSLQGNYESYLALRTRMPTDQGTQYLLPQYSPRLVMG